MEKHDVKQAINDFLIKDSDFSFEMAVLNILRKIEGLHAEHGGLYNDVSSNKPRQFDFRGNYKLSPDETVYFSIECKNFSPQFPIVLHSVPRNDLEMESEYIYYGPWKEPTGPGSATIHRDQIVHKVYPIVNGCRYRNAQYVSKGFDRLVHDKSNSGNFFKRDDSLAYEKISQAVSSLSAMIKDVAVATKQHSLDGIKQIFVPFLVVPDGALWEIKYDGSGEIVGDPTSINQANLYINQHVKFQKGGTMMALGQTDVFSISHIELVTFSTLKNAILSFRQLSPEYPYNVFGREVG